MLNPKDLQDAIVAKLQAIPELIAAVGGADAIEAYDDESLVSGDPDTAEQGMLGIALLVLWTGMELPRTGELGGWTHTFRIALKAASIQEYFVLAQLVFDGVPTGDCQNFLNSEIHPDTDGIQNAEITPVRGSDGSGRLVVSFSIREK